MFICGDFVDLPGTINVKASKGSFKFSQSLDKVTTQKKQTKTKTAKKSEVN